MHIQPESSFWEADSQRRAACALYVALCIALFAVPVRGRTEPAKPLPKVIMLAFSDSSHEDTDVFRAVRAQLSAAPLVLDRVELDAEHPGSDDPLLRASSAATKYDASLVFWIEDNEICSLFFYIPDTGGGRINRRVLTVDWDGRSSRFEVIAIAAASMIEGLLVSQSPGPSLDNPARTPPPAPSPTPKNHKRKWVEIFTAYAGSTFSADLVTHGILLGLGLLPIHRLVIQASFLQNLPLNRETDDYRLMIRSRKMEVSVAGRAVTHPVDIRLGLAWSIDLRSFSTTSFSEEIDAEPGEMKGLNALTPFVSATWFFTERMGLFGRLGASIMLNETIYKVERLDGQTPVVSPFFVKLTYQLGLTVQL